jgi:hypothetical protein
MKQSLRREATEGQLVDIPYESVGSCQIGQVKPDLDAIALQTHATTLDIDEGYH